MGIRWPEKLKPAFWDHWDTPGSGPNFRRKWRLIVLLTSLTALLPLIAMTLVEFSLTRRTIEEEVRTSMLTVLDAVSAAMSVSLEKAGEIDWKKIRNSGNPDHNQDLFVINSRGLLMTSSFYYGRPGKPGESGTAHPLDTNLFTGKSGTVELETPDGTTVLAAYAAISDTGFKLILLHRKQLISDLWLELRLKFIGYLMINILIILLSIMGMATYLVGRIHSAERQRIEALHHEEHANRLASIGRLASGVAHEINNPLEIINQKTGLIIDLLNLKTAVSPDPRLVPIANDVIDAVKRCGTITRQLLEFAHHMEPSIETVDLEEVIGQVMALLEKEVEQQRVSIYVDPIGQIPDFECDRSSLLQIFLNLAENALAAMEDGGLLHISVKIKTPDWLTVTVSDTGKGISPEERHKIFEPFYTSKTGRWGAGLGLAITYGLIKEMGGDIKVESAPGKGSRFILTLPLKPDPGSGQKRGSLKLPGTGLVTESGTGKGRIEENYAAK